MGLEDQLYGSKTVRDFLKMFSEQQWNRLCKATIMLGMQYLSVITNNDIRSLSVKDIEDIVGKNNKCGISSLFLSYLVDLSLQQVAGGVVAQDAADMKQKNQKKKVAKSRKAAKKRSPIKDSQTTSMAAESDLPPNPTTHTNSSPAQDHIPSRFPNNKEERVLTGSSSARAIIAPKAPSVWRRGEGSHNPPMRRG